MKSQRPPLDYWSQTALNSVKGGAIFATVAIAIIVVYAASQMGRSAYDNVAVQVLIMIFACLIGGTVAATVGICLGFLFPVRNGPPFVTRQFPLKFSIVGAFFLLYYVTYSLK